MSITFLNDPKLGILIPVIYLVWQDDTLTRREVNAINDFINTQEWLTKAEKDFLKSKANLNSPPGRSELYQWKEMINKAVENNVKPENLTELGLLIANAERTVFKDEDIKKMAA